MKIAPAYSIRVYVIVPELSFATSPPYVNSETSAVADLALLIGAFPHKITPPQEPGVLLSEVKTTGLEEVPFAKICPP